MCMMGRGYCGLCSFYRFYIEVGTILAPNCEISILVPFLPVDFGTKLENIEFSTISVQDFGVYDYAPSNIIKSITKHSSKLPGTYDYALSNIIEGAKNHSL